MLLVEVGINLVPISPHAVRRGFVCLPGTQNWNACSDIQKWLDGRFCFLSGRWSWTYLPLACDFPLITMQRPPKTRCGQSDLFSRGFFQMHPVDLGWGFTAGVPCEWLNLSHCKEHNQAQLLLSAQLRWVSLRASLANCKICITAVSRLPPKALLYFQLKIR